MNVRTFPARPATPTASAPQAPAAPSATPVRHLHRERDFGIGYGNSSGYGRDRRYTSNGFAPLFRCA